MWELACVGAGLPAMQAPRYVSCTEVMLSQASQLPQKADPTQACSHVDQAFGGFTFCTNS
ncbi:hypothetical protein BFW87_18200 [Pseudomonas fluorescens]|uniref:Uncharacterized protein n=1 Tax=Pseudomonas fluorescens TaxID=294 RepID=A0A1T2YKY6_PSEFL|nr:hypothetical protein BFW87_18200 [Pseudomonas fluorescens]